MTSSAPKRFPGIDALRGLAIVQMIVFHFVYNLNQFGWVQVAVNRDQPWAAWRIAIVTQFMFLVGVSGVLRAAFKPGWGDFFRRWREVAGAAAIVSFGSWLVFGPRWIQFGILHFIAVALILARLLLPLGLANLALGVVALAFGLSYADPRFDASPANWIGLVTELPSTEDYVPILPWIGVVLLGSGLGSAWQRRGFGLAPALQSVNATPPRLLVLLGSWPLTVYLIHEPILAGLIWSFGRLFG